MNIINKEKKSLTKLLYIFVTSSFVIPIIYIILKMIFGKVPINEAGYHSLADYSLMIVECVLGLLVINIPTFLGKKFKFTVPAFLYVLYIVFLYCAIFLGEVRSFYYLIPYWDVVLHSFSSLMLGFFGFMVITVLNRDEDILFNISPVFASLCAFSFAVTIGTAWEIYEFVCDSLLGLNMQKFMLADGTSLIGHEALTDTMKDIIIDVIGALISSLVGFFAIKNNKKWLVPELIDEVLNEAPAEADTEKGDIKS